MTINERDFWGKVAIDHRFCVVCFVLPDARAGEIPQSLRPLLRRSEFKTKAKRRGKVIRVTSEEIRYYTFNERRVRRISLERD